MGGCKGKNKNKIGALSIYKWDRKERKKKHDRITTRGKLQFMHILFMPTLYSIEETKISNRNLKKRNKSSKRNDSIED